MEGPVWQSASYRVPNIQDTLEFFSLQFFSIELDWSRAPEPEAHSDIPSTFSCGSFISRIHSKWSIWSYSYLIMHHWCILATDTSSTKLGTSVNSMDSSDLVMMSYTLVGYVKNDPLLQKSSSQIECEVSSINPAVKKWHFQEMSSPQRWIIIFWLMCPELSQNILQLILEEFMKLPPKDLFLQSAYFKTAGHLLPFSFTPLLSPVTYSSGQAEMCQDTAPKDSICSPLLMA